MTPSCPPTRSSAPHWSATWNGAPGWRLPPPSRGPTSFSRPPFRTGAGASPLPTSPDHLATGHGPDDHVRLISVPARPGRRGVGLFVGQVKLAGEEPDERPPRAAVVGADGPPEGRIAGLKLIEDGPLRDRAVDAGQSAQVRGQDHPNHGSVWTSTDSTAGRSRTIGAQLSPESAEA